MLKVILHRPVQACVIAVLSGLVVACAVFTPLYQRALEQASVTVELANAPAAASMLQISSIGILSDVHTGPGSDAPPVSTDELDQLVPRSLRRSFEPPIPSVSVSVIASNGPSPHPEGSLVSRSEACAHLELTTGQCPEGANQIAVSAADADNFGWQPGMRVPVVEKLPDGTLGAGGHGTLTVTGVYRNPAGRYWGGWRLTGYSGTRPDLKTVLHDTWITDQATFAGSATWRNPSTQVDLPLDRAATGFDQLLSLGPKVSALQRQQSTRPSNAPRVQVASELTSLADTVREGSDQARITVPVLMTPLGILGLVVLWMALGAAAEQRRPEVAVARLRGRGVRGARAHLLRELLTVVLAGVPIGVLAALGVAWLARHLALPGDAPLELRLPVWEALLLAVAAVTITTVLVSARVSREPIGALLRHVPPRRVGWALGTADAVALTAAASIVGAFVTGKVTGPVALAAPAVLALAVGLLISRLATPVATRLGRSLLTRGSPSAGVPLLHLARHPGTRSMIALLTVSAAILVFAGDAVAVGARNRDLAAAQQVGAPMVATISDGSLSAVQDAIGSIGPSGTDITPVVVQHATGYDDQTNLFVEPSAFARIAELPASARAPIRALTASGVKPIELTGRHFALLLSTEQLATGAQPVELAMQLLRHDGSLESVALGQLPSGTSAPHTVELAADCAAGCVLTGWQITTNRRTPYREPSQWRGCTPTVPDRLPWARRRTGAFPTLMRGPP